MAVASAFAQGEFEAGDEWRAPYTVGQRVLFSPSGRPNDFKPATVTENTPGDAMRVNVPDSPQRAGGTYIVYGKSYIKTNGQAQQTNKGERGQPPAPAPAPHDGAGEGFAPDEAWRAQYKVGDKIKFTISGRKSDTQECTVTENAPGGVMRVECEQFKQWVAGKYIVYNKSHVSGAAGGGNGGNVRAQEPGGDADAGGKDAPAPPPPQGGPAPESLAGTYWQMMSRTKKGQPTKTLDARPDVEFNGQGQWSIRHYGGAQEAGTYRQNGSRVAMTTADGEDFGKFSITRNGDKITMDDGEYVMVLRFIQKIP